MEEGYISFPEGRRDQYQMLGSARELEKKKERCKLLMKLVYESRLDLPRHDRQSTCIPNSANFKVHFVSYSLSVNSSPSSAWISHSSTLRSRPT